MSIAKGLLLEIRDSLLGMRDDDEAALYVVDRIYTLTKWLDEDVSQHHYKWARMGLCGEDEFDEYK